MKKKLSDYILIIGTLLIFLTLIVGSAIKKDVNFSSNENRYLEGFPKFSIKNILSGKYEEKMEDYLSDQIIFREEGIKLCSRTYLNLGIRDINDVYVCKDNRIVQKITSYSDSKVDKNINRIKELSDYNLKVMIVPSTAYIYSDNLPNRAITFDEDKLFNKLNCEFGESFIDLRGEFLLNKDKNLYYYTDHHWTNEAIKLAYSKFKGYSLVYNNITLTEEFLGTLYSKVLLNTTYDVIETIDSAYDEFNVNIEGNNFNSIMFNEYLETKDKYAVFLGGNYSKVEINRKENLTNKSILLIKDSFANSFIPYLLNDYDKIILVDTRYFMGSIKEILNENKIDDVLVLFGVDDFLNENIVIS